MQLSALRGGIRKTKGVITLQTTLAGRPVTLSLMKGPLLEVLKEIFPEGEKHETGISLNMDTGLLTYDAPAAAPMAYKDENDMGQVSPAAEAPKGLLLLDEPPAPAPAATTFDLLV